MTEDDPVNATWPTRRRSEQLPDLATPETLSSIWASWLGLACMNQRKCLVEQLSVAQRAIWSDGIQQHSFSEQVSSLLGFQEP